MFWEEGSSNPWLRYCFRVKMYNREIMCTKFSFMFILQIISKIMYMNRKAFGLVGFLIFFANYYYIKYHFCMGQPLTLLLYYFFLSPKLIELLFFLIATITYTVTTTTTTTTHRHHHNFNFGNHIKSTQTQLHNFHTKNHRNNLHTNPT